MTALDDDITRAKELFEAIGPLSSRKMFGGAGLYMDGVIFGVIVDGEILIKGDDALGAALEAEGSARWVYDGKAKDGQPKQTAMPYWRLPDAAHDDPELAAEWGARALAVAKRAPVKKPRRKQA